tara:strand:+ start:251 stop:628 length:378 start_codon:yes stop_codon:yes gene_type:complete
MIGLIFSGITKIAGQYLDNKSKQSVAKSNLKIAQIDAKVAVQKKIAEGDVAWETAQAKASDDSFKDELWTIFFVLIIAASFIEPLQPAMARGFEFLKTAPDFIQYGILASIAASFGLKSIGKFKS